MTTTPTPTTELEAVNVMLAVIDDSPTSSLTNSGNVDAVIAQSVLNEHLVDCLSRGWQFNTDKKYPLSVSGVSPYECALPANVVQVDPSGDDAALDFSVRGGKLWDRENHSFSWAGRTTIEADVVWLFPFEECPQAVRRYVTLAAAHAFQKRVVGSETIAKMNVDDVRMAWADLRKFEAKTRKANMLTDSWSVARVLDRRP